MRFIELFCGIGGFRLGLTKVGQDEQLLERPRNSRVIEGTRSKPQFTCVWANDNDKYACQIYRKRFGDKGDRQLGAGTRSPECSRPGRDSSRSQGDARQGNKDSNWHEPSRLYEGDIRTVDPSTIPEHDLLTAGFPCQSFSIAGKRGGFEDTRGTLFFEICRILRVKGTKYVLLENVKGLLSHDDGTTFQTIIGTLDELGYDCQWQVLNSKDYGVPQNRERVFIIGHLRGQPRPKVFPIGETDTVYTESDGQVCHAIDSNYHKGWLDNQQRTMVFIRGVMGEDNKKWLEDGKDFSRNFPQGQRVYSVDGISAQPARNIRRLTPTECERLQGFPDGWTEGISDTQRYKCLGNAVTVNVIEAIGRQLALTI